MATDSRVEELLKRPLYVYHLPQELLASITLRGEDHAVPVEDNAESTQNDSPDEVQEHAIATSTSCALCKVNFVGVQEQREHVRGDHHKYNVKAQLRGNPVLDEAQFTKAVGEFDESISGSESDTEEEEEGDQLTTLLKRQAKISQTVENGGNLTPRSTGKYPLLWFSNPILPPNTSLGVYRALFTTAEQEESRYLAESLKKKQLAPVYPQKGNEAKPSSPSPHIFMCMIGGGHFAAMIVSLAPEVHRKEGGIEERQARVVAHKTFHRYTTRRKQGGSQSANDASKGAAHSAGSSLRRYNEAALEKEIRELLQNWRKMIDEAQFLFVRAAGTTNRRILFGQHDGQVLKQNDPRLRGFPFSTRRATQSELMRCFKELTRVKISHIDEAALAAAKAKEQEAPSKPSTPRPQQKPKLSKEEEAAIMHTMQIQALIRRSKVPALLSYLTKNSITSSFTFHPPDIQQNFRCPTLLHLAANLDSPAVVLALLSKADADPTATNGEGRTPFELAGDRTTRDAFRVARHDLGESKWNWEAAKVPPALSKAEVDSRSQRERKIAEEEESNRRKAELERLRREESEQASLQASKKGGRALGSVEKTAQEKREEEMRGMTPEMRMRLERERRARAAEERIRRMQQNR
ncbi:putative C2H2 finger and ankyrin domain protein [Aspergillus lucknowensis]|uniref:VLRF1 domain-containing protein n=1 Tax=Aspergillus lucknowensis TaxID=176173 RepID=A0ABR4LGE5_9EURO